MTWRAAIPLAAIAVAGCIWSEPGAPRPTGVSPTAVTRGQTVILSVSGEGFEPHVTVDFDDPGRSQACIPLRVELRAPGATPPPAPVPLHDLQFVAGGLRGRMLGDAGKATWDVVVIDAEEREATLPAALVVSNCEGLINTACDDGEPCTFDSGFGTAANGMDKCTGNAACVGSSKAPDGASCDFDCTDGSVVPGACVAGACVPGPGSCDPPPACSP
jgi:hypothetical protein